MLDPATAAAIAAMGTGLGPPVLAACRTLFDAEQSAHAAAQPPLARDCAYGPDSRHRLDLYAPQGATGPAPVVLFVHGGGFLQGDKAADGWANAAVGRMAARRGWLGAVMNYRLAPDHMWPEGAEDVAGAVDWLAANAAHCGGDPARIVLIGTSAGAVHVSGFLRLRPDHEGLVRGAVLLSGLYGYTPLDPRDERYYGPEADYAAKAPREAVASTTLPLLVACAEFDPPRFQAEWHALLGDRLTRHDRLPQAVLLSGHNHYTMAMHLGTSDTRLETVIAALIAEHTGPTT